MKKHLKRIERRLAGVKPWPAGSSDGETLADIAGFIEGRRRDTLDFVIQQFAENRPEGPVYALNEVGRLACRGRVHPRALVHLAFILGAMVGRGRERRILCKEVLPDFFASFGIHNARVAFADGRLSVNGVPVGGKSGIEILDDGPLAPDGEVTWQ